MDPRKPTGEILSVYLLKGLPLSRWFIAEGLTHCAGRDGSPSQMMVLLMPSSHTLASVEVLHWLLSLGGKRGRWGVKAKAKGGGVEGVWEYTGTQTGHSVPSRTTCRHLHLEGSIPCYKQLRVPLESKIYWFRAGVNRSSQYLLYSLRKAALFMFQSESETTTTNLFNSYTNNSIKSNNPKHLNQYYFCNKCRKCNSFSVNITGRVKCIEPK